MPIPNENVSLVVVLHLSSAYAKLETRWRYIGWRMVAGVATTIYNAASKSPLFLYASDNIDIDGSLMKTGLGVFIFLDVGVDKNSHLLSLLDVQ